MCRIRRERNESRKLFSRIRCCLKKTVNGNFWGAFDSVNQAALGCQPSCLGALESARLPQRSLTNKHAGARRSRHADAHVRVLTCLSHRTCGWPAPLFFCSHYLNSRVMLYQTVGRGSREIPLKQLRIRGPARLSETEIATDAEC